MPTSIKALALIAMGLFLYSRFFTGSLFFYINERFIWLTILASLGFILVGASYRYRSKQETGHNQHQHGGLSWAGLLLVMSPVILGLIVPPRPLGAAAMGNRDVSFKTLPATTAAGSDNILAKPQSEKNILDWLVEFQSSTDLAAFEGQQATVTGFVYRDDRFDDDSFMVSRFVLSCCAADAAPIGLVVRSPESSQFSDDSWVEVSGHFVPGPFDGAQTSFLVADSIETVDIPDQPYLYPY
jgi:uncharacterized repeat protein (TIGR03943 family)